MGLVKTEITIKNAGDITLAKVGYIKPEEIREMTATVLVDSGAWTLAINEEIRQKLGLDFCGKTPGTLANGDSDEYEKVGPVEVIWKDRNTICEAVVLPNAKNILLGAIPLEAMDLIINPAKQEVVGAHGDQIMHIIY